MKQGQPELPQRVYINWDKLICDMRSKCCQTGGLSSLPCWFYRTKIRSISSTVTQSDGGLSGVLLPLLFLISRKSASQLLNGSSGRDCQWQRGLERHYAINTSFNMRFTKKRSSWLPDTRFESKDTSQYPLLQHRWKLLPSFQDCVPFHAVLKCDFIFSLVSFCPKSN